MSTRDAALGSSATLASHKVSELLFDPENPRLPENTVSKKLTPAQVQEAILQYFRDHGTLDELMRSFADNGYFKTEPLIVTRDGAPAKHFIVLEGNRRLAALRLMLNDERDILSQIDVAVDAKLRRRLEMIPVLEVARREDATAMIGFKHIGGLKYWDSDAKARWIAHHVDAAARNSNPFGHVARMVGMPQATIRYYYIASGLMNVARDELKFEVRKLTEQDRFGVFLRAIENPDIREFIGLGRVSEYREAKETMKAVRARPEELRRVLSDIAEPDSKGKFVVGDSRNIPKYGDILANKAALKALRSDSFEAAAAVLHPTTVAESVRGVLRSIQRLRSTLDHEVELSEDVVSDVKEIQRIATGLRTKS